MELRGLQRRDPFILLWGVPSEEAGPFELGLEGYSTSVVGEREARHSQKKKEHDGQRTEWLSISGRRRP